MILEEAIKLEEHTSENYNSLANTYHTDEGVYLTMETKARNQAEYHEQLAEWLKELKTHRDIHDVLLQTLVDFDLDICCDDLMDNEEEQKICDENCNSKTKGCWVRWAKMKAMEKCKNADSNMQEVEE